MLQLLEVLRCFTECWTFRAEMLQRIILFCLLFNPLSTIWALHFICLCIKHLLFVSNVVFELLWAILCVLDKDNPRTIARETTLSEPEVGRVASILAWLWKFSCISYPCDIYNVHGEREKYFATVQKLCLVKRSWINLSGIPKTINNYITHCNGNVNSGQGNLCRSKFVSILDVEEDETWGASTG